MGEAQVREKSSHLALSLTRARQKTAALCPLPEGEGFGQHYSDKL